jgi:hypothetical protein
VLLLSGIDRLTLHVLLDRYGLVLTPVAPGEAIRGSYWGDREAGLIADQLYARLDTPVHSILHEAAHFICTTPEHRARLHTDAAGDDAEESAVCYLQILLAQKVPGVGETQICSDMDAWGYSFRLGAAALWYANDAEDARLWLLNHGIIDQQRGLTFRCRESQ